MSFNVFFENVCVLLLLLLAVEIHSQIRFPSDDDYRQRPRTRPTSGCNCIPVGRCDVLRYRRDWRTAGETCEFGYGEYRRVCCPGRRRPSPTPNWWTDDTRDQNTPNRPPNRVPVKLPKRPTPRPTPPVVATNPPVVPNNPPEDCGQSRYQSNIKTYIVGGQNATEGQFPWMVGIRLRETNGEYTPWCTGFLIDRIHFLSAAHCFERTDTDLYRARIGRIIQDEADEYRITRITMHAGYTPRSNTFYNDIAILTLDREVNFPNFNPICLPNEQISRMNLTNRGTTVAGWGAASSRGEQQRQLKYLPLLPILSNQECQKRLRNLLRRGFQRQFPQGINRGFLCAAFEVEGQDSCVGDSGGPLMFQNNNRWYAIGIVSFGFRCGQPGVPGGYTKVSNYLDWIRQNIRD